MSMLAHVRPVVVLPQRPGIYAIVHLPTGRCSIGSAVNLRARHQGHDWRLRSHVHPNQHLQNAWNKYGAATFACRILDYVDDVMELVSAEQAWIDTLAPAFNVRKRAQSNQGLKFPQQRPRAKRNYARAERHSSRTHPERMPRGDRHGARTHPEKWRRGEAVNTAKLTADDVRAIRHAFAQGGITKAALAQVYGVSAANIGQIISGRSWAHVD